MKTTEKEIWKDIEGYEGLYQISSFGRVKSLKFNKEHIMTTQINKTSGYYYIGLRKPKAKKNFKSVHRLVAEAFIPNPDRKPEVNHIDGNKDNCRIENLEWLTRSENEHHAYNTGLKYRGFGNPKAKTVHMYNLNGVFIRKYGSTHEASIFTGIPQSSISCCCRGVMKKAGNYIWKYE